jgi:hypothetical protein
MKGFHMKFIKYLAIACLLSGAMSIQAMYENIEVGFSKPDKDGLVSLEVKLADNCVGSLFAINSDCRVDSLEDRVNRLEQNLKATAGAASIALALATHDKPNGTLKSNATIGTYDIASSYTIKREGESFSGGGSSDVSENHNQ